MVRLNMKILINVRFACKFRLQKIIFILLFASENLLTNNNLQEFSLQVSFAKNRTFLQV